MPASPRASTLRGCAGPSVFLLEVVHRRAKAGLRLGGFAHGRERDEFPDLDRAAVDAIKRRLVLEPTEGGGPPVLRYLATLTLP